MKYLFILLFLSSCINREQVMAVVYLNNFPPIRLCILHPEIAEYGFYRKLNSGDLEFVSLCKEDAKRFKSIPDADFTRLMDRALPKKKE